MRDQQDRQPGGNGMEGVGNCCMVVVVVVVFSGDRKERDWDKVHDYGCYFGIFHSSGW